MICMAMVGTPPKFVMPSTPISLRALAASKWCIITILAPAATLTTITARHPVAWKSGTFKRLAFADRASSGTSLGNLITLRWATKKRFIRLVIALRCEPTAPLGVPVVPEV